jgi:hypothetical protein
MTFYLKPDTFVEDAFVALFVSDCPSCDYVPLWKWFNFTTSTSRNKHVSYAAAGATDGSISEAHLK